MRPINPGNSGGALLNMDGEVVGINSSKLASTEVEGMGYAIAISDVADSLENMMNAKARDKVDNHGILGITGSTVSTEAVQIYGIPQGVFVSKVTEGGPADDAGITKNMVITEFDGKTITSIDQLVELLQYYEPKEKIDVTVAVLDGNEYKEKTLTVKLGKDDSSSKIARTALRIARPRIPRMQISQISREDRMIPIRGMQMHLLMMEKPACLEILSRMACMTDQS